MEFEWARYFSPSSPAGDIREEKWRRQIVNDEWEVDCAALRPVPDKDDRPHTRHCARQSKKPPLVGGLNYRSCFHAARIYFSSLFLMPLFQLQLSSAAIRLDSLA